VTAVLELVREGNVRPTAKEIAARAGVSLRSVYVHFDDLDDLFDAAGARQTEEVAHLLYAIDPELPRRARIDELVAQRAAIWEALAPVRRAVALWTTSSPTLQEGSQRVSQRAVRDLTRVFGAELQRHDASDAAIILEALNVACCAGAWETLRTDRGLSVDDASAVMNAAMTALLEAP
jgi:TetR/AcrR family transcriptional regulator, regulator of autoinduction and epiphytic fitness